MAKTPDGTFDAKRHWNSSGLASPWTGGRTDRLSQVL